MLTLVSEVALEYSHDVIMVFMYLRVSHTYVGPESGPGEEDVDV